MDFLLLNPVFNFHVTLYSESIVNFIKIFTMYLGGGQNLEQLNVERLIFRTSEISNI